jgi:hypothetical protein
MNALWYGIGFQTVFANTNCTWSHSEVLGFYEFLQHCQRLRQCWSWMEGPPLALAAFFPLYAGISYTPLTGRGGVENAINTHRAVSLKQSSPPLMPLRGVVG